MIASRDKQKKNDKMYGECNEIRRDKKKTHTQITIVNIYKSNPNAQMHRDKIY